MTGLLISLAAGELLAVLTAAWMVRWRRRRQRDEWERLHRDVLDLRFRYPDRHL